MAKNVDLERVVGKLIMDPGFRTAFFAAVDKAPQLAAGEELSISTDSLQITLSARQIETARKYRRECLDQFLACLKDDGDIVQEAW